MKKQKQDANPGAINTRNIFSFGIELPSERENRGTSRRDPPGA